MVVLSNCMKTSQMKKEFGIKAQRMIEVPQKERPRFHRWGHLIHRYYQKVSCLPDSYWLLIILDPGRASGFHSHQQISEKSLRAPPSELGVHIMGRDAANAATKLFLWKAPTKMGNSPIKLLVTCKLILAKVKEKEMVERFGMVLIKPP
ncbi:hypothetical protein E5676_scaffold994G00280 [Cucumis melo var. makuwa]|uniref:Uncharacterized protein n=1 Tax=Cucumis melo var. makuwa TaxID=1194695 RepID=A0A5D3CCE4_CUCMM|nr:hypothetical protein E6C27_scaffold712G00030 [Cucumis melo var. makuwa]TYK09523.1 hypothetical protein E5676_scaffold994G00280 [Cucumis melo var. makuwa]